MPHGSARKKADNIQSRVASVTRLFTFNIYGDVLVTIHPFKTFSAHDDTMGGRLSLARDAAQLSTQTVATRLGISPLIWSHWENDRDAPPEIYLDFIANILGVTRNWLTTGLDEGSTKIYQQ